MIARLSYRYLLKSLALLSSALMLAACNPVDPEEPQEKGKSREKEWEYGVPYVYDREVLPEIHIEVPLLEWNNLLAAYDANKETKQHVHCDVRFIHRGEETIVKDAGIRIRGNGSRRRPEGSSGKMHVKDNTKWRHFHIGLNFHKYVKDDEHTVHGARKVNLKFACNDVNYVREVYSYDLFRRAGIWSVSNAVHCRVWIKVQGDSKEAYYGIYTMYEPVDESFLKYRKDQFGSAKGNLWKCRQPSWLNSIVGDFGPDEEGDVEHTYELKTNVEDFGMALVQMQDFITKLNSLEGQQFHDWIGAVCDVPYLLRTYAVNVALGQWDDYWANGNNYYLYFNSTDLDYKVWFIPMDYDNALGTSKVKGELSDAGRHDPMHWGLDKSPLIRKILAFDDYAQIYKDALLELADPASGLLYYESSIDRINGWYSLISKYVSNDTDEDMKIGDSPVSWSTTPDYRLMDKGDDVNFFKVKCASIQKYCK